MKILELTDSYTPRLYQQSIFANSLGKNTLIVLPTGLGKTLVAVMLSLYYFNKQNKKVLFLAPTKPLVEQQEKAFKDSIKTEFSSKVLTGQISPEKRLQMYGSEFIFSTPQLIENDIINRRVNPEEFALVIFDECHRAVGNYAYTFIAEQFNERRVSLVGLSASPGSSEDEIMTVVKNLFIEHIEVKQYDDPDVKEYVNEIDIRRVEVELPESILVIRNKLIETFKRKIKSLQEDDFFKGRDWSTITKKELLDLQASLRSVIGKQDVEQRVWRAISVAAGLMKLQYGIELLESQEITAAYLYFNGFFKNGVDTSKAVRELVIDINFREAYEDLTTQYKLQHRHPKLIKLREIVTEEVSKDNELKMIIFSQYRDSAQVIVNELKGIDGVSPVLFVGQAKKGEFKLSQKEQKQILNQFREGEFNVLVSTSVGEEGLDIPKVDLVIFYEPLASAIRSIQRVGRTGRFKQGKAYILQTKGTRDIVTNHIASAREKRMYRVLNSLKQKYQSSSQSSLHSYISHVDENKEKEIKREKVEGELSVIIDTRENTDLVKALMKLPIHIETKKLDVGDIVISEHIAIERKSKIDFINSILDKRLFPQLMNLTRNFRRPVLILEGEESIYALRNLNPNVIRSSLSSIAIDLRIPIIFTESLEETAHMIHNMAKRTIKVKKDISLVADKRSFSENEEMEKFVSTIPKINVVTAKSILKHFRSIQDLVNAPESELIKCEGLGKVRAKYMKEFFEREYKLL